MLANQAQACTVTPLIKAVSAGNTAAATSAWTAVSEYEGDLMFIENIGTVTGGTITGKIQHADDDSGTGVADVTGATFTQAGTASDERTEKIYVSANKLKAYVRYIGTIVTGPAVVAVEMVGTKKYTS